ncbi:MAG: hypothetical protein HGA31_01965 [Candidatus Moranbacteria bacterium]|nr:hypothetical protein [Candidatus Moranbacteria bacterium]
MTKKFIYLFLFAGSAVGGYVPSLWGESVFSMSSIFWSCIGGLFGIYVGFKLGERSG